MTDKPQLKEGNEKKCGVNDAPRAPQPEIRPPAQKPKHADPRHVMCPLCLKDFLVVWNDYSHRLGDKITLRIDDYTSGGVYDVRISCPHCDYEEG